MDAVTQCSWRGRENSRERKSEISCHGLLVTSLTPIVSDGVSQWMRCLPPYLYRDLDRSMMDRNLSLVLRETVSASALRTGTTAAIGFPFFMTTIVSFFASARIRTAERRLLLFLSSS